MKKLILALMLAASFNAVASQTECDGDGSCITYNDNGTTELSDTTSGDGYSNIVTYNQDGSTQMTDCTTSEDGSSSCTTY